MKTIIDAKDGMLGRIAAFAAKQSLLGKEIIILNCNDSLITGNKATTLSKYKQVRARGGTAQRGPYFPKTPERIMKRTIRGMLPHHKGRGRDALKRVMCYNRVPTEFEKSEKLSLSKPIKLKAITLKKLSEEL